jgi:cell division septation protein DedD
VAEPVVAETAPIPSPVETVAAVTTPVAVAPVVQPVSEVVAPVAVAPVVQPVPAETASFPVTDSSLPFITSLDKGAFYIQIASCAEVANAKKLVDAYGKKYPVSVERGPAKNGDIVKVYIGPVRKDEYGAMLERFKLLGFKDAFVKKGQ